MLKCMYAIGCVLFMLCFRVGAVRRSMACSVVVWPAEALHWWGCEIMSESESNTNKAHTWEGSWLDQVTSTSSS